MNTLIYIGLLGVFAYNTMANYQAFKGSSKVAKTVIGLLGCIGQTIYYISIIWSFWHFDWWQPIVTFIISMIAGGIVAPILQRNLFGIMVSPIALVVFAILSIIGLLD